MSMKRYPKPLAIAGINMREKKINPKPAYQRGTVLTQKQKQLLMDTLLRDLDIPKFYLRAVKETPYEYEVVDGQQRLRAIGGYSKDKYRFDKDMVPVILDGVEYNVSNKKFSELPDDLKDAFINYQLDVVILEDSSLDEVEEMFLRLQNGSTLTAAEKRNALPGQMKYFIRKIAEHPFFIKCAFTNKRYDFQQVAAQMTLLELTGDPCNVRNRELDKMYSDNLDFDYETPKARKIKRVLDFLNNAFQDKTPELKKHNAISLYLLVSELMEKYVISSKEEDLFNCFIRTRRSTRSRDDCLSRTHKSQYRSF
jgi:hypothetical protein